MVCNHCWELGTNPWSVHHLRYGKVLKFQRDTMAQGTTCMWCDMLVQVWNEHPDNKDWRSSKKLEDATIHLHAPNHQDMRFRSFEFAFHKENEHGQASGPLCRAFVVKLSVEQTEAQSDMFNFIKESIRLCESGHPEDCRAPDIGSLDRLPTRLLEIETEEGGKIRLVECRDRFKGPNSFRVRYAALSHCWGPKDLLKTTRDNLENMKRQIHWEHLPATFKDAIKVCRHLSTHKAEHQDLYLDPAPAVEYLWIDSLCIIQDEVDFDEESVKMCAYYGNAFITISGTSSEGSDKEFLEIPKYRFSPWAMTIAGSNREVRRAEDHEANWHGANTPLYNGESSESLEACHPTFNRGWIFQENSLARRTIHFTKLGVIYECRHPNINLRLRAENTALLRGTKDNFSRIQIRSHNSAAAYRTWHVCVEKYFPLSFGHESDRLIAIGGLAQRIRQSLDDGLGPDAYLAGLWGRNIAADLCWRLDRNDGYLPATMSTNPTSSRDIHSKDYVAPSWSWASVRGSRLHITSTSRYFESMVDLKTHDLAAKDGCFGKIQRCSITLVAPKREMRLSWTTNHDPLLGSIVATDLQGGAAERPLTVFIDTALHVSIGEAQRGGREQECVLHQVHEANVNCILVGRDDTTLHGLVLTNAVTEGASARVGYFCTDNLWEMDRQGQTFVETFEKVEMTII